MRQIIPFIIILTVCSCNNSKQAEQIADSETVEIAQDTVLVKVENELDNSYEIVPYSKSFTYCWTVGNDTLDLKIRLTEYVSDSSVQLRIFNRQPNLFSKVIAKVNECLPLIRENFELDNLSSLYFESPIFYNDLMIEFSQDYESQFGRKNISYEQLNEFLMNSFLEEKVSKFLDQFDKTTRTYRMEKFHLLDKEYYNEYVPSSDLNQYPEFSIHGMGVLVIINE